MLIDFVELFWQGQDCTLIFDLLCFAFRSKGLLNILCPEFCRVIEIKATLWQNCQPRTRRLCFFHSWHSTVHVIEGSISVTDGWVCFWHLDLSLHTHTRIYTHPRAESSSCATRDDWWDNLGHLDTMWERLWHTWAGAFFVSHTSRLLPLLMNDQYDHCPPFKPTGNWIRLISPA